MRAAVRLLAAVLISAGSILDHATRTAQTDDLARWTR